MQAIELQYTLLGDQKSQTNPFNQSTLPFPTPMKVASESRASRRALGESLISSASSIHEVDMRPSVTCSLSSYPDLHTQIVSTVTFKLDENKGQFFCLDDAKLNNDFPVVGDLHAIFDALECEACTKVIDHRHKLLTLMFAGLLAAGILASVCFVWQFKTLYRSSIRWYLLAIFAAFSLSTITRIYQVRLLQQSLAIRSSVYADLLDRFNRNAAIMNHNIVFDHRDAGSLVLMHLVKKDAKTISKSIASLRHLDSDR